MANLIIIGNGFDLAHGLKTSYGNFINHLFECYEKSCFYNPKIIQINTHHSYSKEKIVSKLTNKDDTEIICGNLLYSIIKNSNHKTKQWCDIEYEYFKILTNESCNIESLQIEFKEIKSELEKYLTHLKKAQRINNFTYLFSKLCQESTLILNFNYTDTVQQLYHSDLGDLTKSLHIHGELNNKSNPMIFGFAADNSSLLSLFKKNNNRYLENIKMYQYKNTDIEEHLKKFLAEHSINIYIIGHSCGLSDKFILQQIFTHPNVKKIIPFYYEINHEKTRENYQNLIINIDRVTDNTGVLDKVPSINLSCRIPQLQDKAEIQEFTLQHLKQIL